MSYLIDTHILLWWLNADERLGSETISIIKKSRVLVSIAAVWEILIKIKAGKLHIPGPIEDALQSNHFGILDIKLPHVLALDELPQHHQDPFDRIQLAQARSEGMTFITSDKRMQMYDDVRILYGNL